MLARIYLETPHPFLLPEAESYTVHAREWSGYLVRVFPPRASDSQQLVNVKGIELNGRPAFVGSILQLEFYAETFNRSVESDYDPPLTLVRDVANDFLKRIRFAGKAGAIREIEFPECAWKLEYLTDEGSQLPEETGLIRGRGTLKMAFSWIALDQQAWDLAHALPAQFEPPPWHSLLLDASEHLPQVGPALAIAGTAMEVFIASTLNALATQSDLPEPWWIWINDRGNYLRDPSVDEQFGVLLKLLCGRSAKEVGEPWQSFVALKSARNKFVHTGTAVLGGGVVTATQARKWIADLWTLTDLIREWLPEDLQWPRPIQTNRTISVVMAVREESRHAPRDPIAGS